MKKVNVLFIFIPIVFLVFMLKVAIKKKISNLKTYPCLELLLYFFKKGKIEEIFLVI